MQKTFVIICVVLAVYMTTRELSRYFKNADKSTIHYKSFASTLQDTYPTFSFCLIDEYKSADLYFRRKQYFHKDEDITTSDLSRAFARILKGQSSFGSDIRNLSEADYIQLGFAKDSTVEFERLLWEIEFKRDNPIDRFEWRAYDEKLNRSIPFYYSYQDPGMVCYTRKDDKEENIVRIEDTVVHLLRPLSRGQIYGLDLAQMLWAGLLFKIFVHHPRQLLRGLGSPTFESSVGHIASDTRDLYTFAISQVSILRKRSDANSPCNNALHDDDLRLREKVAEETGCIPVYWKNLMETNLTFEICKTPEQAKRTWNTIQNFSRIFSTYQPPCNEMKSVVTYDQRTRGGFGGFKFKYMVKNYEEIINEREFGAESLWSTVGGFIGIFVGTSLSQVPNLIAIAWNWLRSLMK